MIEFARLGVPVVMAVSVGTLGAANIGATIGGNARLSDIGVWAERTGNDCS